MLVSQHRQTYANFISFSPRINYYLCMGRYVFGPVPSRRLGFSLGVDIIPPKYCTFDCIYCQIGKTTNKEITRKSFFNPVEIVNEVIETVNATERVDFVTFSGSGEPTLNSDIGWMIRELKSKVAIPITVITNGSLLSVKEVREDLRVADVVLPSLDAVSEDLFRYINRPHALMDQDSIIGGLKAFREAYSGKVWLEIMLIRDVNDDPEELGKIKEITQYLNVDKIQLNTVVRPPSEETAGTMEETALEKICEFFGDKCEIIPKFDKTNTGSEKENWTEMVLQTLKRRSLSLDDIAKTTGAPFDKAHSILRKMEKEGKIRSFHFGDTVFYVTNE